jgi:F-type H+-transporting ATPase subunit delta
MNQSKISVRYAKALFQLAIEKNILEDVRKDILLISQSLKEYEQFRLYLKSPVVKPSQKFNLMKEIFTNSVTETSLNFLGLLVQNKRENHLEDISRQFLNVYSKFKGIKAALITTAVLLDESIREKLYKLLSSTYKTEIDLVAQQDASILGGFILRVGDQQYDASIANGLKRMKTALLNESI